MRLGFVAIVLTFFMFSCNMGANGSSDANDKKKAIEDSAADAEREAKIAAKREAYYNNSAEQQVYLEGVMQMVPCPGRGMPVRTGASRLPGRGLPRQRGM